jgi:hypothetical protein
VVWSRNGWFSGPGAIQDFANPAQLDRLDWYSAHDWKVPYPGDKAILTPNQVPGYSLPAGYLGDQGASTEPPATRAGRGARTPGPRAGVFMPNYRWNT